MAAYSLMKNTRVMMHTFCGEGARTKMQEMSHGTVYGKEGLRVVHVLYNGKDHYDCLLELRDYKRLEPGCSPRRPCTFPCSFAVRRHLSPRPCRRSRRTLAMAPRSTRMAWQHHGRPRKDMPRVRGDFPRGLPWVSKNSKVTNFQNLRKSKHLGLKKV